MQAEQRKILKSCCTSGRAAFTASIPLPETTKVSMATEPTAAITIPSEASKGELYQYNVLKGFSLTRARKITIKFVQVHKKKKEKIAFIEYTIHYSFAGQRKSLLVEFMSICLYV